MIGRANSESGTGIHHQAIGLSSDAFQSPDGAIGGSPDSFDSPDEPITEFLAMPELSDFGAAGQDAAGRGLLRRRSRRDKPGASLAARRGLPQFVQALAEQMLAQGSTAEDVARAARECGFTKTTAAKVGRWLDRDPGARERIVRRQLKTAEDLQSTIGAGGPATDALRADVALLGKRAESGASSPLDVQDLAAIHRSLRAQLQTENDSLKRRAKRLEARKAYLARRIEHAQMRLDHARLQVVQSRLGDLRDALRGEPGPPEPSRSAFAEIVASLCQLLGVRC